MTSFVTCIKICTGYEDFIGRLKVYVENIVAHCTDKPFEIIVVEEMTTKFVIKNIAEDWIRNVRLIEYIPKYANPYGYNMIEAFAKNVGIREAKFPYVCVTNADVFFDVAFFKSLESLKPDTFYRYRQYEIPLPKEWSWASAQIEMHCARWINPQVLNNTVQGIAYKSGDVMLMHRDCWSKIKGYPENEVWVHSDLIVCVVVSNNGMQVEIPEACVYTYAQLRNAVDRPHEMNNALLYAHSTTCN